MICAKCGTNIPDDSKVCSVCGTPAAQPAAPAAQPAKAPAAQPAKAPAKKPAKKPRKPMSAKTKKIIIGVAGGIVGLAFLGFILTIILGVSFNNKVQLRDQLNRDWERVEEVEVESGYYGYTYTYTDTKYYTLDFYKQEFSFKGNVNYDYDDDFVYQSYKVTGKDTVEIDTVKYEVEFDDIDYDGTDDVMTLTSKDGNGTFDGEWTNDDYYYSYDFFLLEWLEFMGLYF